MIFDELRSRYGASLAVQIMEAFSAPVFNALELEALPVALQERAEVAYMAYSDKLDNTPIQAVEREQLVDSLNKLRAQWQEAEELAYHVLDMDAKAEHGEGRFLAG